MAEQLGNIGSDVHRAVVAHQAGDEARCESARDRALELLDLTLADTRWRDRYREIARARELFCDALIGENEYNTPLDWLDRYFLEYAIAARKDR